MCTSLVLNDNTQISYAFKRCKNFENRLRFDKVTESLKVGTIFETQCSVPLNSSLTLYRIEDHQASLVVSQWPNESVNIDYFTVI